MLQSYKELKIWQRTIGLVKEIYKVNSYSPKKEICGLSNQVRILTASTSSSIAEGCKRKKRKEYLNFLSTASASVTESETQVIISKDIYAKNNFSKTEALLGEVQKKFTISVKALSNSRIPNSNLHPLSLKNTGQSILEVIIAMAIFALISSAMISLVLGSFLGLEQGGEYTQAGALAQEGIEAVRSIRDSAWNKNIYSTSSVSVSGSNWVFDGEGTTEKIGQFTRTIDLDDVCRDISDNIADCPASYTDAHSKKITSEISWETGVGATNLIQKIAYLTNWDSREWTQTNWSGGGGQSVWSDTTMYSSDNDNIDLRTTGEAKLGATIDSVWSPSGGQTLEDSDDTEFDQGTFADTVRNNTGEAALVILDQSPLWAEHSDSQSATTQDLFATDFVSASDVWAVGNSGKILNYNGTTWSQFQDTGGMAWNGIDMVSSTTGWTVGESGKIYIYNGTTWSQDIDTGGEVWNDVSMVSSSDGWAIGDSGALVQYNGSWSESTAPIASNLEDIDMIDTNDGWAVGNNGTVLHYNGTKWSPSGGSEFLDTTDTNFDQGSFSSATTTGTGTSTSVVLSQGTMWGQHVDSDLITQDINDVHVVSSSDIWAVGDSGKILHYDGTNWTQFQDVGSSNLFSVYMVSANDGWAVGSSGKFYHYNGTTWSQFQDTGGSTWYSVHMVSANDGWAVGNQGLVYRYNGSSWSQDTDTGNQTWRDIYMTSSSEGWMVRNSGKIYHYNGSSWSQQTDTGGETWRSVYMLSSVDGWVVGNSGAIAHWDGSSWTEEGSTPVGNNLFGVEMLSSNDVWVTGRGGKILHYNGVSWTENTDTGGEAWNAIGMITANSGFVVGNSGEIFEYNSMYSSSGTFESRILDGGSSANWDRMYWSETLPAGSDITIATRTGDTATPDGSWSGWSGELSNNLSSNISSANARYLQYRVTLTRGADPGETSELADITIIYNRATTSTLRGIFSVSSNDVWAVGINGTIIHYDGSGWAATTSPVASTLYSVYFSSANNGWAVGSSGKILRFDGSGWSEFSDEGGMMFDAVLMVSSNNGWVIGSGGRIFQYNSFYKNSGTFESRVLDSGGAGTDWNTAYWTEVLTAGSDITIATRTGDTATPDGSWSGWSGELTDFESSTITSSNARYIQYRATFTRGTSPGESPNLDDITIIYGSAVTETMNDIDTLSASDVWAVGNSGKILHYDGSAWSEHTDTGADNILTVEMVSTNDGWAAGGSGKVYRYNGLTWSEFNDYGGWTWRSIDMVSASDGWLVGNSGRIWHYNGSTWTLHTDTGGQTWYGIYMVSANDGWVVGNGGEIYHYDGSTWTLYTDTGGQTWYGIYMVSANDGWLVGNGGKIYRYNGSSWSEYADTGGQTWRSVYMSDSNNGWVVGNSGAIYLWDGSSWTSVSSSPTSVTLRSVEMVSPFHGWAVGNSAIIELLINDGYIISSAFDTGSALTNFNIIEWDEIVPACSPTCSVKFQVRVAADSGGAPSTWSGWYGASGVGTYFTYSSSTLISTDLNDNQWVQHKAFLTGDGITTPILQENRVNYR